MAYGRRTKHIIKRVVGALLCVAGRIRTLSASAMNGTIGFRCGVRGTISAAIDSVFLIKPPAAKFTPGVNHETLQNRTVHGRCVVSQSGLALIGQAINRYTTLAQELDTQVPLRHGIKHSDVVKSYLGLVSADKTTLKPSTPLKASCSLPHSWGSRVSPLKRRCDSGLDHQAKAFLPVSKYTCA